VASRFGDFEFFRKDFTQNCFLAQRHQSISLINDYNSRLLDEILSESDFRAYQFM